jgi:methanol--5-hydroxybenzimidazolylcobamide Co-methyltransferase
MEMMIKKATDLVFGRTPRPVTCGHDLAIGNGQVFPEINFTLPQMTIDDASWPMVIAQYVEIIESVCRRAVELKVPGLVVEFELLPPMTSRPEWGGEITRILADTMKRYYDEKGLRSALRATPVDIRDTDRPPKMRTGEHTALMFASFEACAAAGAHLLSIESTGGKEVHDQALMNGDIAGIIFALGVLGVRDMQFIWQRITQIAEEHGSKAAGDTACGFANTAMILADKGMIPKVLASVVRVISTVRSLQAYKTGAVGPSKDCAYEGPFLKAITGVPISMEGRSSACAHLSHLGNIAAAACDLWSNESVQNVRLLSEYAPVVSLEQLAYDCRLMNRAAAEGKKSIAMLQRWSVESDSLLDPQAYVLRPEVVLDLAARMTAADEPLRMTITGVNATLDILEKACQKGEIQLSKNEVRWLQMIRTQIEIVPDTEPDLLRYIGENTMYGPLFLPEEYGL